MSTLASGGSGMNKSLLICTVSWIHSEKIIGIDQNPDTFNNYAAVVWPLFSDS